MQGTSFPRIFKICPIWSHCMSDTFLENLFWRNSTFLKPHHFVLFLGMSLISRLGRTSKLTLTGIKRVSTKYNCNYGVTRWWIKSSQFFTKVATEGFLLKIMIFKMPKKYPNFWATFVCKFVAKFQKPSNLVTPIIKLFHKVRCVD